AVRREKLPYRKVRIRPGTCRYHLYVVRVLIVEGHRKLAEIVAPALEAEHQLLEYFVRHQGHLVSREMLAREIWKEPRRATPLENVIDVQITRLRKKVDSEGYARLIHTVRGVGFVLREGEP